MQKIIRGIILATLTMITALFIAGCSQGKSDPLKEDNGVVVEVPKENERSNKLANSAISEERTASITEQMTQGLSNLEVVKIKTAFPLIIDTIEQGQERKFQQIILDLGSIIDIVTFSPFKEDLTTLQKLIQHNIDTGDTESLEFAIKMLNDMTLVGVDYPYDKKSPKAIEGWPRIFKEDQTFNITKSLGNEYPPEIQEIISATSVTAASTYDLRDDLENKQKIIDAELNKIDLNNMKLLKEKSLQASDLIYEIRMSLIEKDYTVEALRELVDTNNEPLVQLLNECISLLPEGDLKVEYSRVLGYIEYVNEEVQKESFDYDLILRCLNGSQESLDDISIAILGNVTPKVNKRYSGVLEMLEGNPVLYDWIKHEQTGEYPDGGSPRRNFLGKVL